MHKILWCLSFLLLAACQSGANIKEQAAIEDVDSWRVIADGAYNKQEFTRALDHYKKISRAVPRDAEIWFRLGNTYNRLGDNENAVISYKEAIIRNNTYSKAWYNRSMVQLKLAAQSFQEATKHLKSDDPVYLASIKVSEDLLSIIAESNKTISRGYTVSKKPVFNPEEVEVIILKKSDEPETLQHDYAAPVAKPLE